MLEPSPPPGPVAIVTPTGVGYAVSRLYARAREGQPAVAAFGCSPRGQRQSPLVYVI